MLGTNKINDILYEEIYNTYSGGVYAGSSYSHYLTDSLNFRKFAISVSHDNERIRKEQKGNIICFYKVVEKRNGLDTLKTVVLNIKELKREGNWE